MTFRKFDTATWTDPWFEDLSTEAKLAFIYLWTNETCNQAGFYEISNKRIEFELGYGIDTVYSELDTRILWDSSKKTVWVKNFFKRQCQNFKFAIAALNSIKNDPEKLKLFIEYNKELIESFKNKDGKQIIDLDRYHTDMVSIPYPLEAEQRREEKNIYSASDDAEQLQNEVDEVVVGDGIDFLITKKKRKLNGKRWESFKKFWTAFDYKKGKREAADAWYDIPQLTNHLVERIISAAKKEAANRYRVLAEGKTPKMAQGWISGQRWEDEDISTKTEAIQPKIINGCQYAD